MKKRHYITLAIVLLGLAASASCFLFPRQLPLEECSAELQHYHGVEGIRASFIKDFPINDTLSVDVTTLQATDSASWETLKNDFHVPPLPELSQLHVSQGMDIVQIKIVPKNDPTLNMDTTNLLNNNVLAISSLHRTISLFYTTTEPEMDAVMHSQFELILNETQQTK